MPQEPSELRRVEKKARSEVKRKGLNKNIDEQQNELIPKNKKKSIKK